MKIVDLALVLSTVLAPLIAVQVSQWLDRSRQRRADRYGIFRPLMITRASTLDPRHVESLNLIDIVFTRKRRDRMVREAWKRYLGHLNARGVPPDAWAMRRVELMSELLYALARNLRFDIDRSVIETSIYLPSGDGSVEQEQQQLRAKFLGILNGAGALPVQLMDARQRDGQAAQGAAQQAPGNGAAAPA